MNKILFPFEVDNPLYKEAYIYAVKLARYMYAELIMLNVFQLEIDNSLTENSINSQLKKKCCRAYNESIKLNNNYLENYAKTESEIQIRINYRFVHGKFLREIAKILKDEVIDLVVIPISEKKEMNKKQFKIIHNDIFKYNNASLLVLPPKFEHTLLKNVVFATDLKKLKYHELYLNDILRYAHLFKSRIHFVHCSNSDKPVLPKDTNAYRTMMQIIAMDNKHTFKVINGKNITKSIQAYVKENNIDLLTVVKHEKHLLESLFIKSTSDKFVVESKIPVLVMREKDV